jgi:hypothetical protein
MFAFQTPLEATAYLKICLYFTQLFLNEVKKHDDLGDTYKVCFLKKLKVSWVIKGNISE